MTFYLTSQATMHILSTCLLTFCDMQQTNISRSQQALKMASCIIVIKKGSRASWPDKVMKRLPRIPHTEIMHKGWIMLVHLFCTNAKYRLWDGNAMSMLGTLALIIKRMYLSPANLFPLKKGFDVWGRSSALLQIPRWTPSGTIYWRTPLHQRFVAHRVATTWHLVARRTSGYTSPVFEIWGKMGGAGHMILVFRHQQSKPWRSLYTRTV